LDPKAPKKTYRGPDNKVISAPKNITTNPEAKGLSKFPPFKKDEYNRAREKEIVKSIDYQ
jgi:hypothetical protein